MFEWDDGQPGEDCLRVNVWPPAINDHGKRPVLFWIHGGGFSAGSGQELKAYHGENVAKRGDVVVVTVNHGLNVLGYLNLAEIGDKYASSANVGMLDLVMALEWVRDNIGQFGGDPGRVLIHGQSGGGGDDARALAAKMSDAWVAFARTGDPNHPGLPKWPVYNKETGPVMIFDNRCEVTSDPDREARKLLL
jgi:para-nitrobenzyl esterase